MKFVCAVENETIENIEKVQLPTTILDISGFIQQSLKAVCPFTTDAGASGELILPEKERNRLVDFTIETGIGGGAIQEVEDIDKYLRLPSIEENSNATINNFV